MSKVALAYSGSLDTTICVYYLKQIKGMRVITFSANIGQFENLEPLMIKAMELGAHTAQVADLRHEFALNYVFPALRANAVYENRYYLFSALARPLIIKELVRVAKEEGCDYIAHGSRGIGNDWIRFKNCLDHLAPELNVILPLQELELQDPKDDIEYAKEKGLPIEAERKALRNIEENLWGANIQIRNSDKKWDPFGRDAFITIQSPSTSANKPEQVEIGFEKGTPVSINGQEMEPVGLIQLCSKIAGRHNVGRIEAIETRIMGQKSFEVYEAPAAMLLYTALHHMYSAVLDKETFHSLPPRSNQYAQLVYDGLWYSPIRTALDSFFSSVAEPATGTVRMSVFKGMISLVAVESKFSRL